MRENVRVGREVVAEKVRYELNLSADREADKVVKVVLNTIVAVIRENIDTDGFTLKLPGFGKFTVRHKIGRARMLPLMGKVMMTANKRKVKFTPLQSFRELETHC
jgi:nucleoid DNA-binding protein